MRLVRLACVAVAVTGCGGGSSGGGTPPPPAVASVVITPASAQSIAVGGTVQFSAQPQDAQSNNLSRTVTWTTSDAARVSLSATTGSPVTATGVAAGASNIRATSEGVPSTQITVTVTGGGGGGPNPSSADVTAASPSNTFIPPTVTIAPGGAVTWTFQAEHNVTFGTNKPTGGDIGTQASGTAARTFPNAGSYPYTCTLHGGMNGTVTVQ